MGGFYFKKVDMKRTPLKHVSTKKQKQVVEERKLKAKLLERCQGLCETCGKVADFRGLQVHHKTFRSHGGKSNLENCTIICAVCHSLYHNINEQSTVKPYSKETQLHRKIKNE
jgi:5-methylcytosine-specific restriction endonuclease McrA